METARSCLSTTPEHSDPVPGVGGLLDASGVLPGRWNICNCANRPNSALVLFWAVFAPIVSFATPRIDLPRLSDHATISLVTYSPGDELYTAFGHSSIRVRDDAQEIRLRTGDAEVVRFFHVSLHLQSDDLLHSHVGNADSM